MDRRRCAIRRSEFIIGDTDVLLGHIGGAPVYISASQFEALEAHRPHHRRRSRSGRDVLPR